MSGERLVGGSLELEQDRGVQAAIWRAERVGWVAMGLVVAASLAGLLGPGALPPREVRAGDLLVEHPRFTHHGTPAEITVLLASGDELLVSWELLGAVDLTAIVPEPLRSMAETGAIRFVFDRGSAAAPVRAVLSFTPRGPGVTRGELRTPGGPPARVSMLVYP